MEYMTEKLSDVGAERAVLAGVWRYGADAWVDVDDLLSPKVFTTKINKIIYACFQHIFAFDGSADIDLPRIFSAAKTLGLEEELSKETKFLRAVGEMPIKLSTVRQMAAKIFKLDIIRNLKTEVSDIEEKLDSLTGDEDIADILATAEQPIYDFGNILYEGDSDNTPQSIGAGINEFVDWLEENEREQVGIASGFPTYDYHIGGGFRGSTVNVIGARPKVGKTMLADNIALYVAGKSKIPVLNLDTEMTKEDHWCRMLANVSEVPTRRIETGKFKRSKTEREKVRKAAKYLHGIPYEYLSIVGKPYEETISLMRRWLVKSVGKDENGNFNPCLFIYDYIKLMTPDGLQALREYQMLGFLMTALHNFAKKHNVPVLSFIQLNRDGILTENSSAASGSDRIIWLCSNFSIFKKKEAEEEAEMPGAGNRKLIPIDMRHGEPMDEGDYINLHFRGHIAKIKEGQTRNDWINNRQDGSLEIDDDDEELLF